MEGHCATGQSPLQAVEPMEERNEFLDYCYDPQGNHYIQWIHVTDDYCHYSIMEINLRGYVCWLIQVD
jgi:hypothetical protein